MIGFNVQRQHNKLINMQSNAPINALKARQNHKPRPSVISGILEIVCQSAILPTVASQILAKTIVKLG